MLYQSAGILSSSSFTWTSDFRASRIPPGWLEYWTRWPAYQQVPAKTVGLTSTITRANPVVLFHSYVMFSPTAVDSATAAAHLPPHPEEAAGVPVCQRLLWLGSRSFGTVRLRSGLLRPAGVDSALLGPSRTRFNWSRSSLSALWITWFCFCCVYQGVVVFPGSGTLLSQLSWFHIAGSLLFVGASLLQHQCIVLLARLRIGKSGELWLSAFSQNMLSLWKRCFILTDFSSQYLQALNDF